MRGQIGKPGAGLCPVRGHSNVQGDRTMGIWEKVNEKFFVALEKEFEFTVPRKDGFQHGRGIAAMRDGRAKIFFAMGGNFRRARRRIPNSVAIAVCSKCRLTAQVITKLNRTALATGEQSLILPCLGRSEIDMQAGGEQFVSTESTMLNVQMSKGIFEPASEHLRSEPWIVAQLAKATLGREKLGRLGRDGRGLRQHSRLDRSVSIPGCENYNERIREPGGFYLPNPPREGKFATDTARRSLRRTSWSRSTLRTGQTAADDYPLA